MGNIITVDDINSRLISINNAYNERFHESLVTLISGTKGKQATPTEIAAVVHEINAKRRLTIGISLPNNISAGSILYQNDFLSRLEAYAEKINTASCDGCSTTCFKSCEGS